MSNLVPWKKERPAGFEVAVQTIITKVAFATHGRTAWHDSWSSRYHTYSFKLETEECKDYVEIRRVQGSTWWIHEVPALAFVGQSTSLVVAQLRENTPLRDVTIPSDHTAFLVDLAYTFLKESNLTVLAIESTEITKCERGYQPLKSRSVGGYYRLLWLPRDREPFRLSNLRKWQRSLNIFQEKTPYWGIIYTPTDEGIIVNELKDKSPLKAIGVQIGNRIEACRLNSRSDPDQQWVVTNKTIPVFYPGARVEIRFSTNYGTDKGFTFTREVTQSSLATILG